MSIVRICQSRNNPVSGLVEANCCYLSCRIGKVIGVRPLAKKERCIVRHGAKKSIGYLRFLWFIEVQLQNRCLVWSGDPDRPEGPLTHVILLQTIRIAWYFGSGLHYYYLDIFNRHLAISFIPGNLAKPS